jgi:FixJ family two-component response regulator
MPLRRTSLISPRSLEVYRAKLMTKMDARSLPELIQRTFAARQTEA